MRLTRCSSLSVYAALFLLDHVSATSVARADKPHKDPDPDCTVTNPLTNEFYDLRPLIRHEADKSAYYLPLGQTTDIRTDWHINGHDYDHNFTLNICEPVLSDYSDVVDVSDRTNVSGYYTDSRGDKISIGYYPIYLSISLCCFRRY
jgi:hypothetical protein